MGKFNFKKYAQAYGNQVDSVPASDYMTDQVMSPAADPGLLMQPSSGMSDVDSEIETKSISIFDNHDQMYRKLKDFHSSDGDPNSSFESAWEYFAPSIKDADSSDNFKKNLIEFFRSYSENPDGDEAVDIADKLFEDYSKVNPPESEDVSIPEDGLDLAKASTLDVIKIAKDMASKEKNKKQLFNLHKTAQHKTISDYTILSGPSQTSLSPFSRDIQSGLHLIEQNKGFGIKIDDILDIDFEAIWRGNIMDKYNSPYRDKDGNYVGGYINRRFEVNQNVPVGNNLQLAPGTRRRPWMPEYSTIESRMEVSRGNKDKLQDPASFAKISIGPFNLKKKNK